MTKKVIVLTVLMMVVTSFAYGATNWSKFENKGNNLGVEGYQGQPGYIRFADGNGSTLGYIWICNTYPNVGKLVYCSPNALDLTTTQLTDYYGVLVNN